MMRILIIAKGEGEGGRGGLEDFGCFTIKSTWSPQALWNIFMIPLIDTVVPL